MTFSKDTCRKEIENSVLVDSVTESNDRGNSTPASAEMKTSGNTLKDSIDNIKKKEQNVGDKDSDMLSSQPTKIDGSDTDSRQPSDQSKPISSADASTTKKPNAVQATHPKVLVPFVPTKEQKDDISDEELNEMLREVRILMGIDEDPQKEDAADKNTDKSVTSSTKLTEKKLRNKEPAESDNQNEPMEVDDIPVPKVLSESTEDKKSKCHGKCSSGTQKSSGDVVKDINNNNIDMEISDYEETEKMEVDCGYHYQIIQDIPTFPWFKEHVKRDKPEPMIVEYLEYRIPPLVKNCPQPMEWKTFHPRVIDTPSTRPKYPQKSQNEFRQPVSPRSSRWSFEQGIMANMHNAVKQKQNDNRIIAEAERKEYLGRKRIENIRSNVAAGIAEIRAEVEAMEKVEQERERVEKYRKYSRHTRERRERRDADRYYKQNSNCYRDMNNANKRRLTSPANNREMERDVGHVKKRRENTDKDYDREVGGGFGSGTDKHAEERLKPRRRLEKLKYVVNNNEENQPKRSDIEKEDTRPVLSCQRYGKRWRRTTRKHSRWD